MSKYTTANVMLAARDCNDCGLVESANMLREYAAHLAAQAEWPSEEDVERFCESMAVQTKTVWADYSEDEKDACRKATSAALQSVRPPVGVVSDEDVERSAKAFFESYYVDSEWLKIHPSQFAQLFNAMRSALESYASCHAPTKD